MKKQTGQARQDSRSDQAQVVQTGDGSSKPKHVP